MGIPLCVICCFSLAAFNICSLCLIFVNLINMCLGVFCLELILFGILWVSWTWVTISFPILGKYSTIISSSIFSWSFFLSSSSGTPIIRMLGCLTLSQRSLIFFLILGHTVSSKIYPSRLDRRAVSLASPSELKGNCRSVHLNLIAPSESSSIAKDWILLQGIFNTLKFEKSQVKHYNWILAKNGASHCTSHHIL